MALASAKRAAKSFGSVFFGRAAWAAVFFAAMRARLRRRDFRPPLAPGARRGGAILPTRVKPRSYRESGRYPFTCTKDLPTGATLHVPPRQETRLELGPLNHPSSLRVRRTPNSEPVRVRPWPCARTSPPGGSEFRELHGGASPVQVRPRVRYGIPRGLGTHTNTKFPTTVRSIRSTRSQKSSLFRPWRGTLMAGLRLSCLWASGCG